MATPTSVGVRDKGKSGKLSYDIPKSLKDGECSFNFKEAGNDQVAVFELKKDGEVQRYHHSKPFAIGSLAVKKQKKSGENFVVKVSKKESFHLKEYFF